MTTSNGFPTALAEARRRTPYSQSALSIEAGLDASFVSRLEMGKRMPSRETVLALAEALGLDALGTARLVRDAGYWPTDRRWAAVIALMEARAGPDLSAIERDILRLAVRILAPGWNWSETGDGHVTQGSRIS